MVNINSFPKFFITAAAFLVLIFHLNACTKKNQPYKIIKTNELKQMIESGAKKMLIIDARNPEEYEDVHIPGAVNIPVNDFDNHTKLLPEDLKMNLVFYCNGVKCGKSKRAAQKALSKGYKNLLVYAEGMPVWEEYGFPIKKGPNYEAKIETTKISPDKLNSLIKSNEKNYTIVDVRDKDEYSKGHIPSAINIPAKSFAERSGELDKSKTIIVYCNGGNRSYKAYRKLMKLAYKKHYQALFTDWKTAGYQIVKSM